MIRLLLLLETHDEFRELRRSRTKDVPGGIVIDLKVGYHCVILEATAV
jgi:hypothetical protein